MNALRKDLRAIAADGAAANVMVGIGENYFPAFVLALTSSQLASGLVTTVPLVAGGVLQMAAPHLIKRLGSYRRWVVLCAVIQAASFVPLLAASLAGMMPTTLVFGFVALYWATGLGGSPAWNNWVSTLVPERLRNRYMARRSRLAQACLVTGFVFGGVTLQWGTRLGHPLSIFAILFFIAAAGRAVSARCLAAQREPVPPRETYLHSQPLKLAREMGKSKTGILILYFVAVQAAVQISGPYFTPFMLCQLEFNYAQYVTLVAIAYLARVVCLPWFGQLADRWGASFLLWVGGLAIVPGSALWLVSNSFVYLIFVQIFVGAAWAAYELAMLLLFFDAIPAERRVGILTLYNFGYAVATFAGSVGGGILLSVLGETRNAYLVLFAISGVARLATLPLLARIPAGAPQTQPARTTSPRPKPAWEVPGEVLVATVGPDGKVWLKRPASAARPNAPVPAEV